MIAWRRHSLRSYSSGGSLDRNASASPGGGGRGDRWGGGGSDRDGMNANRFEDVVKTFVSTPA